MSLFERSHSRLIFDNGETYTYAEFVAFGQELKDELGSRRLVIALASNTQGGLLGYLTVGYGDHVLMTLDGDTHADHLRSLCERYDPDYLWLPDERLTDVLRGHKTVQTMGHTLLRMPVRCKESVHPELALLVSTSGSTGSPKFVRQSYVNITSNTASISRYLELESRDIAITTLPLSYSYGMSVVNCQIASGGDLVITDQPVVQKPFWNLLNDHHVSILSGVPYTYQMLDRLRIFRKDLPNVRKLLQAGGKLDEGLQSRIATYCSEHNKQLFVMYGQTEATTRMAYLDPGLANIKIGSIGTAIPGGRFELRDDEGNQVARPGETGQLIYHGENVCMGYALDRKDLTKPDLWQGRLETGDLACHDKDGHFYIRGRLSRFMKHFGLRVNLDEVEHLLQSHFTELQSVACMADEDNVLVYTDSALDQEAVRKYLTSSTSLKRSTIKLINVPSIPRLANGKTDYQALGATCNPSQ